MRLVLASGSPRRAELLRAAGFEFVVRPAVVDESVQPGENAESHVRRLALAKAAATQKAPAEEIVLAADTVVVIDGRILGKPVDDEDARAMLRSLSDREHDVLSGVAIRQRESFTCEVERTRVQFVRLSPDDIDWYLASGEHRDKAGAYAIQGLASRFVTAIHGSYSNVVGLPVHLVHELLKDLART